MTATAQEIRTAYPYETEIQSLYSAPRGVDWSDTYRRAIADTLYMFAWMEDRERFGIQSPHDWGLWEFNREIVSGQMARDVADSNDAVRARQPRPRLTAVDNRLAYYDSLR